MRFATEYALNSGVPRFRDGHGRLWSLDPRAPSDPRRGRPLSRPGYDAALRAARQGVARPQARANRAADVGREFPFLSEDRDVVSTGRRALDLRTRRLLHVPRGCIVASRRAAHWVLLCGRMEHGTVLPTTVDELVGGRRKHLAGPADVAARGPAGYWVSARVAPDRRTLLVQWSGE
jgi:hypothetical protein